MFDHYVMFKLREDKRGEIRNFVAMLEQLESDVPQIQDLRVMTDVRRGPKSYDVLYHARFDDEAGFNAYMRHPKHIPVMAYVEQVCSAIADIDVQSD